MAKRKHKPIVSEAVQRHREALAQFGIHAFDADLTQHRVGRERRRCSVCGLVDEAKIHHRDPVRLPPVRRANPGATRAHRYKLAQAVERHGVHKFSRGEGNLCAQCGLSQRSRIHQYRSRKRAKKPAPTTTVATVSEPTTAITVDFGASGTAAISCPWCQASGYVTVTRDELRHLLEQRATKS